MDEVVGMVGMLFPAFFILAGAVLLIVAPIVDHKRSVARRLAWYNIKYPLKFSITRSDAEERQYFIS